MTETIDVVRTHLELSSPTKLRAAAAPDAHARITHHEHITPSAYVELYGRIGGPWQWFDRFAWTESELAAYLASPEIRVYTLDVDDANAGYFELKRHDDGSIEIMYFGLDQQFIGQRLGGWMLTRAVEEAFALGAARVILHTCTLDAPQALPNYLARGFVIMREERYTAPVPSAGTPAARPVAASSSGSTSA